MATALHASDIAVTVTDDKAACSPRETGVPADFFAQSIASQPPQELARLLHADVADLVKLNTPCDRQVPWYAWPLLVVSLVAFSSAAIVFASIPDVPACTLAAWRLQLTTFLLTPAAVYQFLHLPAGLPLNSLLLGYIIRTPVSRFHVSAKYNNKLEKDRQQQVTADDRKRMCKDMLLVLASGAFLGVHFFFWVWVSSCISCCAIRFT